MAAKIDPKVAKEKRAKKIAIGGGILLVLLLAYEGPKTMKALNPPAPKTAACGVGSGVVVHDDDRRVDAAATTSAAPVPVNAALTTPLAPAPKVGQLSSAHDVLQEQGSLQPADQGRDRDAGRGSGRSIAARGDARERGRRRRLRPRR